MEEQLAELIAQDQALEAQRNAALARLDQLFQRVAAAPQSHGRLRRWLADWLLLPLREEQQAFDAATLRLIYQLNELADTRRSMVYKLITLLDQTSGKLAERAGRLEAHNRMLYAQIQLINDQLAGLEDADAQLLATLAQAPALPPASPAAAQEAL